MPPGGEGGGGREEARMPTPLASAAFMVATERTEYILIFSVNLTFDSFIVEFKGESLLQTDVP